MNPRRRSGSLAAGPISTEKDQPRSGSAPDRERVSVQPPLPGRARAKDDWMKPLDEDDLRALEAAWGFVE